MRQNRSPGRQPRWVAVLAVSSTLAGCYDRVAVAPAELVHLDGYDIHNERWVPSGSYGRRRSAVIETDRPYRLVTYDGRPIDFNSQTELRLTLRNGSTIGGRWLSFATNGVELRAQALDQALRVPLVDVAAADVRVPSTAKTVALVLGIEAGVAVTAMSIILGLMLPMRAETATVR